VHIVLSAALTEVATSRLQPVGFGLVTFAILIGLLLLVVAFRNVGNRH
jgi:hypothetical protein